MQKRTPSEWPRPGGQKRSRKKDACLPKREGRQASSRLPTRPRLFSEPPLQTPEIRVKFRKPTVRWFQLFREDNQRVGVHERSGPPEACAAARRLVPKLRDGGGQSRFIGMLPFLLLLFFWHQKKSKTLE